MCSQMKSLVPYHFVPILLCSDSVCVYLKRKQKQTKKTSHVRTENVFVYVFVCAKSMAYVFRTNALFVSSSYFRIEFVELP